MLVSSSAGPYCEADAGDIPTVDASAVLWAPCYAAIAPNANYPPGGFVPFRVYERLLLSHSWGEVRHVEIAPPADPLLRLLDAQRRHQPQTGRRIREDAHHPRAPLDLFVQPLQAIRRAYPGAMRQGERQTGETILDCFFKQPSDRRMGRFPPCRHRFRRRHRLLARRRREDFSQIAASSPRRPAPTMPTRSRVKCTWHRCQLAPWKCRSIAAFNPLWPSLVTNRTPLRPRALRSRKDGDTSPRSRCRQPRPPESPDARPPGHPRR